jgi:hypothetical protein
MNNRMTSWWIVWDDLKWPNDDVYDKIRRRADLMQKSNVDVATVFGAHFRWDFMPMWDCLHDFMRTVADELHKRDIKFFDHHSAVLVHRHNNRNEMRNVKVHSGPHLPFSPSYKAAECWTFNGSKLNDWRMINARTNKPHYLPQYTAEQFCYNNPAFVEAYLEYVKMLIKETRIDGLMCDDAIYFSGYNACTCECCRTKFKNLYGHNIPKDDDFTFWGNWKNQAWRDWIALRYASNGDFLEQVKNILPVDYPLMSCCSGSSEGTRNHCGQDVLQFNRGCNLVHLELCGNTPPVDDPKTVNKSIAEKLSLSSHHLAAAKLKNLSCVGQGYGFTEPSANIIWALNKMLGSSCWFSTLKGRLGLAESEISHLPDDAAAIAKAFSFEYKHKELFDTQLVSQIAVYFSYNTRNNSFFGDIRNGYEQDYTDTLTELFSAGISAETLLDLPKDKNEHPVLVVPSALCLSDTERETLKKYMKAGGKVIATGACGLYDGNGEKSEFPFLSNYGADIVFSEPERKDDFWDGNWQAETKCQACGNAAQWYELETNLLWHPMRLQDENPPDLCDKVKGFTAAAPVEVINAEGYLTTLHSSNIEDETLVVQMLSAEYNVEIDKELDAKRKHRSRVNLITGVKPKNVTRNIVLALNVDVEDIKIFTPFNENSELKISHEASRLNITLPEDCSYAVCKISLTNPNKTLNF